MKFIYETCAIQIIMEKTKLNNFVRIGDVFHLISKDMMVIKVALFTSFIENITQDVHMRIFNFQSLTQFS